ncbi:MAG: PEP-CTERM sorting domain-containing protein [Chthoniobacterales bacterium]
MKKYLALLLGLLPCAAMAATNYSYTATAAPGSNPDATRNPGGTAVDVWTMTGGGTNTFNPFAVPPAWYSTSTGPSAQPLATHAFVGGGLLTGQVLKIDLALEWVGTDKDVGIELLSGGTVVFSLYFRGNNPGGVWRYSNGPRPAIGVNGTTTGIAYGFDTWNTFTFTKTATGYNANFGGAFSNALGGGSIDQIRVYNDAEQSSNGNFFWRELNLSGVPEPSSYGAIMGIAALAIALKRRLLRTKS